MLVRHLLAGEIFTLCCLKADQALVEWNAGSCRESVQIFWDFAIVYFFGVEPKLYCEILEKPVTVLEAFFKQFIAFPEGNTCCQAVSRSQPGPPQGLTCLPLCCSNRNVATPMCRWNGRCAAAGSLLWLLRIALHLLAAMLLAMLLAMAKLLCQRSEQSGDGYDKSLIRLCFDCFNHFNPTITGLQQWYKRPFFLQCSLGDLPN